MATDCFPAARKSAAGPGYPHAMHVGALTATEQRVLGCLIEKRWSTPDQYPLSLNALRLACNQATNRDPVTEYDEATVRDAAQRLSRYGLARLASGHSSRAIKYRHLAEEALGLEHEALAVLAILLLRGPQTPGELKARSERLATFGSLAEVERVLARLTERGYARRLTRRPGQKEDRFVHLLGEDAGDGSSTVQQRDAEPTVEPLPSAEPPLESSATGSEEAAEPGSSRLAERVAALEEQLATLRDDLAEVREELAGARGDALIHGGP